MSRKLPLGGHIKNAGHAHRAVHGHSPHTANSIIDMPLEKIVENHISIAQVIKEIPQPMPHWLGHDLGINIRRRLEQNLIQPVVNLVKKSIALLKWIGVFRILRASSAQKQQRQSWHCDLPDDSTLHE